MIMPSTLSQENVSMTHEYALTQSDFVVFNKMSWHFLFGHFACAC